VTLGAIVYTLVVVLLWRLAACPAGAEPYLLEKLHITAVLRRRVGG
jgi:hypothetical protein